jgi:predicted Rossmann fold nucleotide-binding protein DprA/Smf involved in DNA uptake
LQSGLSLATLVVETGERGGSMHTARFTLAQGRALWVPEPPLGEESPQREGLRLLQSEGALMISEAEVLREMLSERLRALEGLEYRGRAVLEELWLPAQPHLL